jgi:hypothetical protein
LTIFSFNVFGFKGLTLRQAKQFGIADVLNQLFSLPVDLFYFMEAYQVDKILPVIAQKNLKVLLPQNFWRKSGQVLIGRDGIVKNVNCQLISNKQGLISAHVKNVGFCAFVHMPVMQRFVVQQ